MVILQSVGIDISLKVFKVCFKVRKQDQTDSIKGSRTFTNAPAGFIQFLEWVNKKQQAGIPLRFTMEATGVYYESLAYFLYEQGYHVSVVLPNKSKAFMKSMNLKSKTDALEAKALAQMGLERRLAKWEPGSKQMYQIKKLCRERVMLIEEKTVVSNRLHAEKHCRHPNRTIISRMEQRIKLLKKQIKQVEKQLEKIVRQNAFLSERIEKICRMKGLKLVTVLTVVSETNGFALIKNKAQLVSYAGYDVVERESGTSLKGKTRISKKGNRYIRRALYFPAFSVIRYNPEFQNLSERIYDRTKIKMKGAVAVQRKLLVLIYTLFKKNEAYDPNYSASRQAAASSIDNPLLSHQREGLATVDDAAGGPRSSNAVRKSLDQIACK